MQHHVWYKMDNVAKVFLASCNKRDTRSFRVTCTLFEDIDPTILQEAVEKTVTERPQFQVTIHKGFFWHYMEAVDRKVKVKPESDRPCPELYAPEREGKLHYRVTYFHNRINLDMFHALTDGNGGMEFLNIIVQNYLQIKYPGRFDEISVHSGASMDDLVQDSFKQFYQKGKLTQNKAKKAYHIMGLKLPYNQLQFMEFHMSAKEVLKLAKASEASLTSYIGARLMMAIYKDMPALQKNKPITISMPVNLRNYFPSETSRNFFNSVYVSHVFDGKETVEELAKLFDIKLKEELTPEKVAERMNNYEKIEQLLFVRMVPLFIKNPVVASGSKKENKKVTAVVSNLGRLSIPKELESYIKGYSAFCSSENLFITVCSYGDDLTFGIASPNRNTGVLKTFARGLTQDGINIKVYATEVVR